MVDISIDSFNNLIKNPNDISLDHSISIKKIIKKYPYFQTARIVELIGLKKFNNINWNDSIKELHKPENVGTEIIGADDRGNDAEYMYGLTSDGELVLVQRYVFDPLMKPLFSN